MPDPRLSGLCPLLVILALAGARGVHADDASMDSFAVRAFDTKHWSRQPRDCDRLAAHPSDPERVAPGVDSVADLPSAIAACRRDLGREPDNPRLQYQLGRVLTYAGAGQEAWPHLQRAAAAKYPQALFVSGFVQLDGQAGIPAAPCRGGALIHESAEFGRLAGLVGYPAYVLAGRFDDCPQLPRSPAHLRAMLAQARQAKLDYYQALLVATLERELR